MARHSQGERPAHWAPATASGAGASRPSRRRFPLPLALKVAEATVAQYYSPGFAVRKLPLEQMAALKAGERNVNWRAELASSAVATLLRRACRDVLLKWMHSQASTAAHAKSVTVTSNVVRT